MGYKVINRIIYAQSIELYMPTVVSRVIYTAINRVIYTVINRVIYTVIHRVI